MYFHALNYTFKTLLRSRGQIFWCFAFPIVLATMFYFAFGGLAEGEAFSAIPVAVVQNDSDGDTILTEILDALDDASEDDPFLTVTYASEEEALSLLKNNDVTGILSFDGEALTLSVAAGASTLRLEQSILQVFAEQFNLNYQVVSEIAREHPEKLPEVIQTLTRETDYLTETSFTEGNYDESLTYYFNLIAMTCLYAAMMGSNIAIDNQGNLSALGARRCISPVHRLVSILGDLSAALIFQCSSIFIGIAYMHFVLGVDFGSEVGYVLLASLAGCTTGISLGFFIGSFGRGTKETKFGVLMAVIMLNCLVSGLMIGNMRMYVEKYFPVYNHINPAALISDSLYALIIYPSHERYFINILTLFGLSVAFSISGFVLVRRKKYASL